jgi:hypothetical protein
MLWLGLLPLSLVMPWPALFRRPLSRARILWIVAIVVVMLLLMVLLSSLLADSLTSLTNLAT